MLSTSKPKNPIILKVSAEKITVCSKSGLEREIEDTIGVILSQEEKHDGFIIEGIKESSIEHTTKNPVIALNVDEENIIIYEENKNDPWVIGKDGTIINNHFVVEELEISGRVHKKTNVELTVVIMPNMYKNHIVFQGEKFSLSKGLIIGSDIYGFRVQVNKTKNEGTTEYLTTGPIYGMQQLANGKILIYERDKSIPWAFTEEGVLVEEADFNKYLKDEQRQYCEYHGITLAELEQELSETLEIKNYRYRN